MPLLCYILDSAMASFVLYVVIVKVDKLECERQHQLVRQYVTVAKNHVGFRETIDDAVKRREHSWKEKVTLETHELLKVTFTDEGVSELTTRFCCGGDYFSSTLYKKRFTDTNIDWKVWHYIGSLPLPGHVAYDEIFLPLSGCQ